MNIPSISELLSTIGPIFELNLADIKAATQVQVDSLAALTLMAMAAEKFGVNLDPLKLENFHTLGEIADYLFQFNGAARV